MAYQYRSSSEQRHRSFSEQGDLRFSEQQIRSSWEQQIYSSSEQQIYSSSEQQSHSLVSPAQVRHDGPPVETQDETGARTRLSFDNLEREGMRIS